MGFRRVSRGCFANIIIRSAANSLRTTVMSAPAAVILTVKLFMRQSRSGLCEPRVGGTVIRNMSKQRFRRVSAFFVKIKSLV